jgi:hypothetical protein
MRYITGFLEFWYDFIIGDDPWVAAAVVATLIVLLLVTHNVAHHAAVWWLLPLVVIAVLGTSLWRATRTS